MRRNPTARTPAALAALLAGLAAACAPARPSATPARPAGVAIADTPEDSAIFARTIEWARAERVDTLPFGDMIAAIGRRFLGAPYVAGSLDPPGPERLVINLRAFDCVTYVESVLALARSIRAGAGPGDYRRFAGELMALRYRTGGPPAYADRLHYFSEWIAVNAGRGRVEDMSRALGGSADPRPIWFMSAHVSAYPQLADAANLEAVRERERILARTVRYRIAEDAIAAHADGVRPGDVIAATSTVPGLDIAHTGLAVRVDGRLHLMHAPLAGGVVEISALPLAERIRSIDGQDGVMVARPR